MAANAAAGMAFGGSLVAYSLILFGGVHGDFHSWSEQLTIFGSAAAVGVIALPAWRRFVDLIMLPKADLAKEIYVDRNTNAALLETICLLGLALVIMFIFPEFAAT